MVRELKLSQLTPAESNGLQDILNTVKQPAGFSKLSPMQRRQLLAAVLASVIPSDGKVREVEIKHFIEHLKRHYQFSVDEQKVALSFVRQGLSPEQLTEAAKQLQELLSAEDRAKLVGLMWDIALADRELHAEEEKLIYGVADQAGIVRKRVTEEQARAARGQGFAA